MTVYCYSDNEERFTHTVEAESIEEAAEEARDQLDLSPGDVYYVGVRRDVQPTDYLDAADVLEQIGCRMDDEVGDACDGWPEATREEIANLTVRLQDCLKKWTADTANQPRFYMVDEVQSFRF